MTLIHFKKKKGKRMKNIILSDFDGTIAPFSTHEISEETRELLTELKNTEILDTFVIATGRNIDSFKRAIEKYEIDFFDYVICSNGAAVVDADLNVIYSTKLSARQVQEVKRLAKTYKEQITDTTCGVLNEEIYSLTYSLIDVRNAQELTREINENVQGVSAKGNGIYLDVMPEDSGKWKTFQKLTAPFVEEMTVYSFGDGENDTDILKHADYSYSFDFAAPSAKFAAQKIIPSFEVGLSEILTKNR
ncbi:MAG: HAD family hydrolase [Lactobacillales bacterium]|jgi:HAD superfamily hydrolase (TIGR01484 family)|nr:HAD family hydrolase [Lactobacillales bacterium]